MWELWAAGEDCLGQLERKSKLLVGVSQQQMKTKKSKLNSGWMNVGACFSWKITVMEEWEMY